MVLHFVQSVLGYLAMFAAMTYSIELFAAVCLGATTGYALLHLDDAPAASTDPWLPGPGRSRCVQAHACAA